MSDLEMFDAVSRKIGELSHEIQRRGFVLTAPITLAWSQSAWSTG